MSITKLYSADINASDPDKAFDFSVSTLGFEQRVDNRWTALETTRFRQ